MNPPATFTGPVRAEVLASGDPSLAVYAVTFAAGARTHWHTHPCGQGLYVTAGTARLQVEGTPPFEITAGRSVWIPAGARHWHGAGPGGPMTHVAYQRAGADGTTVRWGEPVADDTGHHPSGRNS